MRENNGWEACRKDKGGLFEKAPPSCYLKNEQGPVKLAERQACQSWSRGTGEVRLERRQEPHHMWPSGHSRELGFYSKCNEK